MKYDKPIYYPLFASKLLNGGKQDGNEAAEVRASFLNLQSNERARLLSGNMAEAIAALDEQFHIPEQFVEYVTVLVREMFFGYFSEQEVLRTLRTELAKIPNIPLDAVIQHIQLHIFKAEADPEEVDEQRPLLSVENLKQHTLLDALGKFPNLANQFITTENIKLKSQVAPVRPTLSNWLKNYRDELGIGKHDAVARAKFLFESPNTRKLPDTERDRIHALVRSLEDNENLSIDPQRQEIVFVNENRKEASASSQSKLPPEPSSPSPDIFERFQEPQSRVELQNVGTQMFAQAMPEQSQVLGGEKTLGETKGKDKDAVLSRIKNIFGASPKSQELAPTGGFTQDGEEENNRGLQAGEALGTLRFSAKHVLPAEKYSQEGQMSLPVSTGVSGSRLEHFRPKEVVIPGAPTATPFATGTPSFVPTATRNVIIDQQSNTGTAFAPSQVPLPIKQEPVIASAATPTQTVRKTDPQSIFHIKPNRD